SRVQNLAGHDDGLRRNAALDRNLSQASAVTGFAGIPRRSGAEDQDSGATREVKAEGTLEAVGGCSPFDFDTRGGARTIPRTEDTAAEDKHGVSLGVCGA